MRVHGSRPVLAALALASLASCSSFDWTEEEVLVRCPPLPPGWSTFPDLSFRLEYLDTEGRRLAADCEPGGENLLRLPRGRAQAVLFWPYCGSQALRPGGALHPLSSSELPGNRIWSRRALDLSWEDGWTAWAYSCLETGGGDAEGFDWRRLKEELKARVSDPWLLDPRLAVRRIIDGVFRADQLRQPELFRVALPGTEMWISEDPLLGGMQGGEGPCFMLPRGEHRFFSPGRKAVVKVWDDGSLSLIVWPPD